MGKGRGGKLRVQVHPQGRQISHQHAGSTQGCDLTLNATHGAFISGLVIRAFDFSYLNFWSSPSLFLYRNWMTVLNQEDLNLEVRDFLVWPFKNEYNLRLVTAPFHSVIPHLHETHHTSYFLLWWKTNQGKSGSSETFNTHLTFTKVVLKVLEIISSIPSVHHIESIEDNKGKWLAPLGSWRITLKTLVL